MPYTVHSLQSLIDELTDGVGGSETFWASPEKQDAINEAICVWQLTTGQWVASEVIQVTQAYTRLPHNIVSLQRVLLLPGGVDVPNPGTPLTLTSIPELDYGSPGWDNEVGTPTSWAPVGLNEIALNPPPSAPMFLLIEGLTDAPRLQSLGDTIDTGTEDLTPLLGYGQHVLAFKEAGAEFNSTQSALIGMFEAAGERNGRFKKSAPYRRYMGIQREEAQRPMRGTPSIGVRSND